MGNNGTATITSVKICFPRFVHHRRCQHLNQALFCSWEQAWLDWGSFLDAGAAALLTLSETTMLMPPRAVAMAAGQCTFASAFTWRRPRLARGRCCVVFLSCCKRHETKACCKAGR